jgi:hypothetical protein
MFIRDGAELGLRDISFGVIPQRGLLYYHEGEEEFEESSISELLATVLSVRASDEIGFRRQEM